MNSLCFNELDFQIGAAKSAHVLKMTTTDIIACLEFGLLLTHEYDTDFASTYYSYQLFIPGVLQEMSLL